MNKAFKVFILWVVLLIPALIFIFLHLFGENEFNVPIQHPKGLKAEGCYNTSVPLEVPVIDSLRITPKKYQLVYISEPSLRKDHLNELRRVTQNNPDLPFVFLMTTGEKDFVTKYAQDNWSIHILKNDDLKELNRCGFGNINGHSLILIDDRQFIRGYYHMDKKELDRMEGEVKILTQ